MTLELATPQIVVLFVSGIAAVWTVGAVLVNQFEKRLDTRFLAQDELRKVREAALDARFKKLDEEIDGISASYGRRVTNLESGAEKSPSRPELSELHVKINGVAESVADMSGELRGVSDNVRAIMNRFIDKGLP